MKKVVISAKRRAEIVDAPDPQPKGDWAVVKVHAVPMCTEYKAWVAGTPTQFLGHEAAGEVVAVAQPGRVRVGDRVVVMPQYPCGACQLCVEGDYIHCEHGHDVAAFLGSREGTATFAQYLVKPAWLLPAIPDDLSYERASLACCALGPSFGALEAMGVGAYTTILITGLGPVGLGAIVNARFRGAQVIAVEAAPYRAARGQEMGALVLDPAAPDLAAQVATLTGGRGVDCALDCSGSPEAQRLCVDATRRKGQVAFVGESTGDLTLRASPDLIRKGLVLRGIWHYNLRHFAAIMQVVRRSPLIEALVSHVLPMGEVERAFALQAAGETAKVILRPWA